ncbi:2-phosphosulfolactate phosphatase [Nocardioides sp. 31GB23]|uniref:2-phosphosulfolactate phosphatase n=1 Tax=Nocardioides sp. 31GB23 TaxID=3156065 RepID=UPI0032B0024C
MDEIFGQRDHAVRFDWGLSGALAAAADVCVVVDVLSFSTSVTIAVERGMRVFPFAWNDARAASYAAELDAVLAVGRLEATHEGAVPAPSLSPAGLVECEAAPRLVLPSPNGSTISTALQATGATVLAGCLRNASAVGHHLVRHLRDGRSVAVVAALERWHHDDSLRPALEDHLGAGAVLSALVRLGHGGDLSLEARAAVALWDATADQLVPTLHACVGGCELTAKGFSADVDVAGELDASDVVAVLDDGAFTEARP